MAMVSNLQIHSKRDSFNNINAVSDNAEFSRLDSICEKCYKVKTINLMWLPFLGFTEQEYALENNYSTLSMLPLNCLIAPCLKIESNLRI